jgi:crotonobetainyl-CoA:carnitine CoA-transferase CaiB-like acyl-CoA transferase
MNIIQSGFLTSIPVIVSNRVLAGPHSIQIFGSLGVGIIKIGRFIRGDYTRRMAPHYLQSFDGHTTTESAYSLDAAQNEISVAIHLASPEC